MYNRYLQKPGCHINLLFYSTEDFLDMEKDIGYKKRENHIRKSIGLDEHLT